MPETVFAEKQEFHFSLVLSGTKTIKHEGISAAGASHDLLPYTSALDAEYLEFGEVKSLDNVPVSPNGIVSPVLITKACLELTGAEYKIIEAGSHIKPQINLNLANYIDLEMRPSESIDTGEAMSIEAVQQAYSKGRKIAKEIISDKNLYVIGECVVGGTTTALGVLRALGYKCEGLISSSIPDGNHDLKDSLISKGLEKINREQITRNPLLAIAAMGDPMQAVVLGMVEEFLKNKKKVILAGGTQMMVIAKLAELLNFNLENLSIGTTPWVINDKSAAVFKLSEEIELKTPVLSFKLDEEIEKSNPIFKAYSQGHVKEGVGAGGLMTHLLSCNTVFQNHLNTKLLEIYEKLLCVA